MTVPPCLRACCLQGRIVDATNLAAHPGVETRQHSSGMLMGSGRLAWQNVYGCISVVLPGESQPVRTLSEARGQQYALHKTTLHLQVQHLGQDSLVAASVGRSVPLSCCRVCWHCVEPGNASTP
jgi:hypothetical protein